MSRYATFLVSGKRAVESTRSACMCQHFPSQRKVMPSAAIIKHFNAGYGCRTRVWLYTFMIILSLEKRADEIGHKNFADNVLKHAKLVDAGAVTTFDDLVIDLEKISSSKTSL